MANRSVLPGDAPSSLVDLVVGPRARLVGSLGVNRAWPTARRRLIGPFVFLDHMQPVSLPPGVGLDVPPHPHIGLATVTYLFEGELMHADSLGTRQAIRPGELNWMTAGRGIAHSERTPPALRAGESRLHGIQSWVALPLEAEECEPAFEHRGANELPIVERAGVRLKVLAGRAFGASSGIGTQSRLFYVEADLDERARIRLEADLGQRGVYVVAGAVSIGADTYAAGRMLVLADGIDVDLAASPTAKLMLLGGAPLQGDRHVWWNFVASSAARLERAKADWRDGRFGAVPGDAERMPLPA
jgi:hypothetical protein